MLLELYDLLDDITSYDINDYRYTNAMQELKYIMQERRQELLNIISKK